MTRLMTALAATLATAAPAVAGPAQSVVLDRYAAQAKAATPSFAGFSAERGKALFLASPAGGKPDTPSCTSCHTSNPAQPGRTRAGKPIGPMAVSAKADRYTDIAETEKWFGRNCDSVLGRGCTPIEKGYLLNPPPGRKTLLCQWFMKRVKYVCRSNSIYWSSTTHWLCYALLGCRSHMEYSP